MKKSPRRCTPEYDLRLRRYLGTSPGFWLRLQLDYELMRAEREKGEGISRGVQPYAALIARNVEKRAIQYLSKSVCLIELVEELPSLAFNYFEKMQFD